MKKFCFILLKGKGRGESLKFLNSGWYDYFGEILGQKCERKNEFDRQFGGGVVIIIGVRDNKKLVWVDSSKVSRKEGIWSILEKLRFAANFNLFLKTE